MPEQFLLHEERDLRGAVQDFADRLKLSCVVVVDRDSRQAQLG